TDTEIVGHRRKQSLRRQWLCPSQLCSCTPCLLVAVRQWESWAHFSKWHTDALTGTDLGKVKAEGVGCTVKNTPQLGICEPSHLGPAFVHRPCLLVDGDHRAGAATGHGPSRPSSVSVSPTFCPPTTSRHPLCAKGTNPVLVLQEEEQDLAGEKGPSSAAPEEEDGEGFSFKYSPGKLRGNQYKKMMTKEELEEEQRTEE
uniref:Jumonji domain containing 6, arginine demethylase and lysine hydroxylase n=1 Tax=Saimiri boliviensis boliviensis TaxID=39432 RepID=A0A2K6UF24_SAIBB